MRAAVWHARNDIRVEDVPAPSAPGPGEVIIRVGACGICGTDLEEYRAGPLFIPTDAPNPLTGRMAPLILGHEFAGEVVEVGRGVTEFRVGDRLAPDVLITCGSCFWCQRHQLSLCDSMAALGLMGDGGLAEYCRLPVNMAVKLPHGLSDDHAGIMVLRPDAPVGQPMAEYLGLESDHVLEIGLTPNRMDAMSHYGVARDLRASLLRDGQDVMWTEPTTVDLSSATGGATVLKIEDSAGCPQYGALKITGVIGNQPSAEPSSSA
jgi:hypothetical protein